MYLIGIMSEIASSSTVHLSNQTLAKAKAIWYRIKKEENEIKKKENNATAQENNSMNSLKIKVDDAKFGDIEERDSYKSLPESDSNDGNMSPTMVFSVIGDSDSFVPRPWPTTVFQTALIEAAKSGGETWILYRGYDDGLSKIVKDAYQNYEEMEIKPEKSKTQRHVKLFSLAGNKTSSVKYKRKRRKGKLKNKMQQEGNEPKDDNNLVAFEKFVSMQNVSFFSQQMDISYYRINCSFL